MDMYSILKKAVLSEKSNALREEQGQYTFIVNRKATKPQIKKVIETSYNVKVAGVNVMLRAGKMKRRGAHLGKQATTKRAIIKLADGQKLTVFEES